MSTNYPAYLNDLFKKAHAFLFNFIHGNPALAQAMYRTDYSAPGLTYSVTFYHINPLPPHTVAAVLLSWMDYETRLDYLSDIRDAVRNKAHARIFINAILALEKQFATLQTKTFQHGHSRN